MFSILKKVNNVVPFHVFWKEIFLVSISNANHFKMPSISLGNNRSFYISNSAFNEEQKRRLFTKVFLWLYYLFKVIFKISQTAFLHQLV